MPDLFNTPIHTESDAQGFFFQLHQRGQLFHPEDNPQEIVDAATGGWLFTPDQARALAARMDEIYAVMDDPCDYCLTLINPESDRP